MGSVFLVNVKVRRRRPKIPLSRLRERARGEGPFMACALFMVWGGEGRHDRLARLYARAPVAGLPRMMCQSKDHNTVFLGPVDDGERKSLDEYTTRIDCRRRTCLRKRECPCSRFLDRCGETLSQTALGLTIVGDLSEKFLTCCCNEPYAFHRAMRLASANTSSARYVWTSPRS
jgi:hypothetical protein